MRQSNCRLKVRRPHFVFDDGQRRLSAEAAYSCFATSTGRDPREPELRMLVAILGTALARCQEGDHRVVVEFQIDDDTIPLLAESKPLAGRRPINPQIEEGICRIVRVLRSPRNAALLLLIYGLDASPAFPMKRHEPEDDESFDVWEHVIRPMEKRLSQIEKRCNKSFPSIQPEMWPNDSAF